MGGLVPQRGIIDEIEVSETVGGAEYYADGGIVRDRGDIITSIYYVERVYRDRIDRIEVCRIHYSRGRWLEAMERAIRRMREGRTH